LTVDEWVDSKEAVTFVRTFNIRFPWHKMIAPESCEYRMFRSAFQKRHEINIPFTAKEREE
jgi:ABC-type transporter lipoprotein component MlaA